MDAERRRCRAVANAYARLAAEQAEKEPEGSISRSYYEGAAWVASLVVAEIDMAEDDEIHEEMVN